MSSQNYMAINLTQYIKVMAIQSLEHLLRHCSFEIREGGGGGGWTVRDLLCVKYYGPLNPCVFFPDPLCL